MDTSYGCDLSTTFIKLREVSSGDSIVLLDNQNIIETDTIRERVATIVSDELSEIIACAHITFRSMTICWNNPPRALQSLPTPLPSIVRRAGK